MRLLKFKELMGHRPWQHPKEWRYFLEFAYVYFKDRGIENPIVVELGVGLNRQKVFYEELLGARHIGIDNKEARKPDILGDTYDTATMTRLKEMLDGEEINLLFIDASHDYADVRHDFELFSPMTKNIIALHDIITLREEVRVYWKELAAVPMNGVTKITFTADNVLYGIGLLVKE